MTETERLAKLNDYLSTKPIPNYMYCGGVKLEDFYRGHKWDLGKNLGRCLNLYTCTVCGTKWECDSTD